MNRLYTIIMLLIISFIYLIGDVITGKEYIYSEPEIITETITEECEEVEEIECPRYVRIEKVNCNYKDKDDEIKRLNNYIKESCIKF